MAQARRQFSEAEKGRTGLGRYQQIGAARAPANGVARPVPSANVRTALAAVPDPSPYAKPTDRVQVTVNIAGNVLDEERRYHRISEAAYRVGKDIIAAYENVRDGDELNDRVDISTTPDHAMIREITNAQERVAMHRYLERLVGVIGARFLRAVLVEGVPFRRYAEMRGRGGDRGAAYVADRFRSMLEEIAEDWAATGKRA